MQYANARRPINLVRGEGIEIGTNGLNIDALVHNTLTAINQNLRPSLMGKPLTRTFISSIDAAQDVLKKLDVAMDKVNQTRATMGAVMNRLDHVVNNLTNVSMNLSGSRSQIEDADYASASTELAKTQIMQQAATAVLAQANTSQQSVMKLLQG